MENREVELWGALDCDAFEMRVELGLELGGVFTRAASLLDAASKFVEEAIDRCSGLLGGHRRGC